MPTPLQIKLIHVAAREAGLGGAANRERYQMLLRNVAEVESSKDLTQPGFEDVMAVMEDMGFADSHHGGNYWRGRVSQRGMLCSSRMVHKIEALARDQRYALPPLCLRFSEHRTDQVGMLCPREAWNLIEMLKAVVEREEDEVERRRESIFSGVIQGDDVAPF